MKIIFAILLSIIVSRCSFSQNILDSVHPLFKGELNGDLIREKFSFSYTARGAGPGGITAGAFISNKLSISNQFAEEKIPALKNFRTGTSDRYEVSENGYNTRLALPIFDSAGIIITVNGINKQNAAGYEFRVLENKTTEIIPWRPVTLFCESYLQSYKPDGTEETEVAYLGLFRNTFGNSLTFQIRKKQAPLLLVSLSALWVNRAPTVLGIFSPDERQAFLTVFKKQWQHDRIPDFTAAERALKDSLLILKNNFKPEENSLIFYLDDKVRSKDIIEYSLISSGGAGEWKANDFDLNLIWLKNLSPGDYTLQMRYSIQRQNISLYKFTIMPAWYQTPAFKIIVALLAGGILALILLFIRSGKQKQKLQWEQLQKQQMQVELKSIRSQFNPHFVFNALNSIQGLITKNDMDSANQYLAEFSTLLRSSLQESSHEFVSLATEIKLLTSYLRLEKLRFGFTYTIQSDATIDKNGTEVPALLLQPLVENAIKHGISSLYERGSLTIIFKKSFADMLVTISDNGKGFNACSTTEGFGLKLTKERLALINKLQQDQSIGLALDPSAGGTTIHLLFKNWLS